VDIVQELGAGKFIKKTYVLEKIEVAVKEEFENRQFFDLYID